MKKTIKYLKLLSLLSLLFIPQLITAQNFKGIFSDTTLIKSDLWKRESLSHILRSDEIYTDDFAGFFYRGVEKARDSLYLEAIEDFKKAVEKDAYIITNDIPSLNKKQFTIDALFNIASCFISLDNTDSAEYYYEKIIETDPYQPKAYLGIASIKYDREDVKGMIFILDSAVRTVPGSAELKYNLAIAYLLNNKMYRAKRIQKQIIEQFPHYKRAYILLGVIYLLERKKDEALATLSESIERNPDDELSYYIRGMLYLDKKDYVNAYKDYLKSYEFDSLNPSVIQTLALLDFKYGHASDGLSKHLRFLEKDLSDTIGSLIAPPSVRELYYLLRTCNADTFARGELGYVESFYRELYWGEASKTKPILDAYLDKYPHSVFAARFATYYMDQNTYEYGITSDSVLQLLNQLIMQHPDVTNLWFIKAKILSRQGKDSLATVNYKKGLQLDPEYIYAYYACGSEYLSMREYDSAVVWLDKAIDKYPKYPEALELKAISLSNIPGKEKEAIHKYKSLLETLEYKDYKNDINIGKYKLNLILKKKTKLYSLIVTDIIFTKIADIYARLAEYDSALVYLNKVSEESPNNHEVQENRAYAFLRTGRYEEAIREYDTILERYNSAYYKDAYRARFYFERGQAYFYLKHFDKALEDFNMALKIVPKDAGAICGLADCYRNMGDCDRAIKLYDKAIKYGSDNKWYYFKKAYCLYDNNEYLEAIQYFSKVTFIDPKFAEAYGNIGRSYYKLGKYKLSAQFSQKALQLDPTAYYASFNIGLALLRLGYPDKAYEIYRKTKDVNDTEEIKDYRAYIDDLKELLNDTTVKDSASKILIDIFNYPSSE